MHQYLTMITSQRPNSTMWPQLEPVCCKKTAKKLEGLKNRRTLKELNDSKLIANESSISIIQYHFYAIQKLQRSPIPQTSNRSGTFFAVSYSKPALNCRLHLLWNWLKDGSCFMKESCKKSYQPQSPSAIDSESINRLSVLHSGLKREWCPILTQNEILSENILIVSHLYVM